jgi:isopentenyl-diphosphate Delta-isomerase
MQKKELILVDKNDVEIGTMEKLEAHQKGLLHRAFSVVIFNSNNQMLIHKRAENKYHSSSLWTNACCSHPQPKENTKEAAIRRLKEEMGIECPLSYSHHFIYRKEFENQLVEHELDHVYLGVFDGNPSPNPEEVCDHKWIGVEELRSDIYANPEKYTFWFKQIMENLKSLEVNA